MPPHPQAVLLYQRVHLRALGSLLPVARVRGVDHAADHHQVGRGAQAGAAAVPVGVWGFMGVMWMRGAHLGFEVLGAGLRGARGARGQLRFAGMETAEQPSGGRLKRAQPQAGPRAEPPLKTTGTR